MELTKTEDKALDRIMSFLESYLDGCKTRLEENKGDRESQEILKEEIEEVKLEIKTLNNLVSKQTSNNLKIKE